MQIAKFVHLIIAPGVSTIKQPIDSRVTLSKAFIGFSLVLLSLFFFFFLQSAPFFKRFDRCSLTFRARIVNVTRGGYVRPCTMFFLYIYFRSPKSGSLIFFFYFNSDIVVFCLPSVNIVSRTMANLPVPIRRHFPRIINPLHFGRKRPKRNAVRRERIRFIQRREKHRSLVRPLEDRRRREFYFGR